MSEMINRAVVSGRLTKDPVLSKTSAGVSIVRFTIASDRRKDQSGESKADFISCIAFRSTADFIANYGKKGMLLIVDGRIQTGSYQRNGQTVYTTDILTETVQMVFGKKDGNQNAQSFDDYGISPDDLDF